MGWVRKDLKNNLFLTPCPGQGCHSLDQIAQGSIEPGLEHFHPQSLWATFTMLQFTLCRNHGVLEQNFIQEK